MSDRLVNIIDASEENERMVCHRDDDQWKEEHESYMFRRGSRE